MACSSGLTKTELIDRLRFVLSDPAMYSTYELRELLRECLEVLDEQG